MHDCWVIGVVEYGIFELTVDFFVRPACDFKEILHVVECLFDVIHESDDHLHVLMFILGRDLLNMRLNLYP